MQQRQIPSSHIPVIRSSDTCQVIMPDVSELIHDQDRIRAMQQRLQHLETVYA